MKMKKRILAILVSLCMVMAILPLTVFASNISEKEANAAFGDSIKWEACKKPSGTGAYTIKGAGENWFFSGKYTPEKEDHLLEPAYIHVKAGVNLYFYNCTMDLDGYCELNFLNEYPTYYPAIEIDTDAKVNIYIKGDYTFIGGWLAPGIHKSEKGQLNIILYPGSRLTVKGGSDAAGI